MKANKSTNRTKWSGKRSSVIIIFTITYLSYLSSITLLSSINGVDAIAPTIDYSHNMRILKLPQSTPIGSLIYRLKGSDGDANSQLMFGVSGHEARTLLDVVPVQRSWNEADVYLRSKPELTHYNFTVFVTDGNKTTQVESTVIITDDDQQQQQQIPLLSNSTSPLAQPPFLNTKHVFHVPENAKPNELIGSISVLESEKSDLPVRFELRGKGAEKFSINYVFGPKGQSKGELLLSQELDYEKQNLFSLKVLALNAWTDTRLDTRNVASMDIVITVGDVQDSPPLFRNLPQSIRLPTDLKAGQVIYKCEAEDGDFADQRPIQYALDAGSPVASYFDIDKASGEIKLTKSVAELLMNAAWQQQQHSSQSMLTIFASEVPDPSSYDHLWPPMYARVEIPLLLVDTQNEPPQFIGGWQTRELGQKNRGQVSTLHGYLPEWTSGSNSQLVVRWFTNSSSQTGTSESVLLEELSKSLSNRPSVLDLGLGSNGTFELSLEGADAELFHLEPSGFPISRQTTFTLSVADSANKSLFDHEHNNKLSHLFTVDVVARDFGQPERLSSRIRCLIELVDTNDNWPKFETDLYSFSVYENAPIGYVLGQVRARDSDSGGKVSYVSLSGLDSQLFRLNQDTGQITLEANLDREKKSLFMFLVEARDSTSDHGLSNYTQLIVNVLDVNDNAPVFLQTHYDAVLLSDGSFYQPLQVKAVDADEPGTANSQVAYEIIAGNMNEQFTIDSVSGVIYPVAGGKPSSHQYPALPPLPQPPLGSSAELPSTLKEPILPHRSPAGLDQAGKIRPMHEVEDSPRASRRLQEQPGAKLDRQQQQANNNKLDMPPLDAEQLPAIDMLMSLESGSALEKRSTDTAAISRGNSAASQLGPITTLVVRAHDFGIPLRSSTVRVNIFNQALLTRSVSLILNGTIEQLDTRREAIERAFSSLTGSRATIESLDALSDSSSLSVARVRLAVPEHSLVDLTDLSALMQAIDYPRHAGHEVTTQPGFYYGSGYPPSSNLSGAPTGGGGGGNTQVLGHNIFSDIHSYAIDSNAALERRLLIYIIIVGVCILALLLAWMIYYCCSRNESQKSQKLLISSGQLEPAATYRPSGAATAAATASTDAANKTHAKMAATNSSGQTRQTNHHGVGGSPIANNLAKGRQLDDHSMTNLLTPTTTIYSGARDANQTTSTTLRQPATNYSMYNGQVWFEPNNFRQQQKSSIASGFVPTFAERRASSAPSGGGNSLDSALHSVLAHGGRAPYGGATWAAGGQPRNAAGQFFPNTLGYTRNVASIASNQPDAYSRTSGQQQQRRHKRGQVAPMPAEAIGGARTLAKRPHRGHTNAAFLDDSNEGMEDLEAGHRRRHTRTHNGALAHHRKQSSLDSAGSTATVTIGRDEDGAGSSSDEISVDAPASSSVPAAEMSVELDSDQELLGFDSMGTPIIATHTRATSIKPIVVERGRGGPTASSTASQLTKSRETISTIAHQPDQPQPEERDSSKAEKEEVKVEVTDGAGGDSRMQTSEKNDNVGDGRDKQKLETSEQQPEGDKSTDGRRATIESAVTKPTLMSELTERISGRKGSADKPVDQLPAVVATTTSAGQQQQQQQQLTSEDSTAAGLASSTSASNKRQLMLRQQQQQQQQQGKTTTTTQRSQTEEATKTSGRTLSGETTTASECQSDTDSVSISSRARELSSMKNGELLEKKSIFALTYSGLATDKLPAD